ncbi:hypothetical protein OF390_09400, partial [Limosilactobacillus fermentum]|uniref:hypothetical protein n=1 Tax=Limosilactobacillus fermentum TaxID=1613 RepID=UPI0021E80EDC
LTVKSLVLSMLSGWKSKPQSGKASIPELFTRNAKIPIKHRIQVLDGDFTFSPFKCRKRASALV